MNRKGEKHDKEGREPNKAMVCHKAPWKTLSADFTGKFPSARLSSELLCLEARDLPLTLNLSIFVSLAKN